MKRIFRSSVALTGYVSYSSVNDDVYLNQTLNEAVRPALRDVPRASRLVTNSCLDFLEEKLSD